MQNSYWPNLRAKEKVKYSKLRIKLTVVIHLPLNNAMHFEHLQHLIQQMTLCLFEQTRVNKIKANQIKTTRIK